MSLTICDWKYGKQWVYSITYDEALSELHRFAIPLHEEFGIPGHVEAVAGHIGTVRQIGQSSYNGFHHMGPEELRDLIARGWGVGNHSWSHQVITPEMVDREVRQAKEVLEEAIGGRVPLYCAPGDNTNMADHVLAACRACGYLGAMSLTDALNRPGEELFWLNRTALHDQFYGPFFSEFDPYRNIRHAQEAHGWIIDYCHCPLEKPVHRNKDCSEAQLRRRFETVLAEGGDAVWCANPDEVIDYHLTRRHTQVEAMCHQMPRPTESTQSRFAATQAARTEPLRGHATSKQVEGEVGARGSRASEASSRAIASVPEQRYRLVFDGLPPGVECRALTLEAEVPAAWCQRPAVWVDDRPVCAELVRPRCLRVTVDVTDGMEIVLRGTDV